MLIGLALGVIVALVASSAWKFLRMDDAAEHAASVKAERKRTVFEGILTPRAVREEIEPALLDAYAGDRVKVVVERVRGEADSAAGGRSPGSGAPGTP